MAEFKFTKGQEDGLKSFTEFYLSPNETVMLLKGYSGTGKSTLVAEIISQLPKLEAMAKMLDPDFVAYEPVLSATTNQAAESLIIATGNKHEARTIHSTLGLRLEMEDYRTGKKVLRPTKEKKVSRKLIFVDEVSYIDKALLAHIFGETEDCKFVFIGDPAQLTPVGSNYMPVFNLKTREIELTEPTRFETGPVAGLVNELRQTVVANAPYPNFSKFVEAGVLEKFPLQQWQALVLDAFNDPDKWGRTKILCYTNDAVQFYNNWLTGVFHGSTDPKPGQVMVANETKQLAQAMIANNGEVLITDVEPAIQHNVSGWHLTIRNKGEGWFMPSSRDATKQALKYAREEDDWTAMREIQDQWLDLRPSFACTVNKSQGSTYDTGFIDLGNIMQKVKQNSQLARILYVCCSRFRKRMFFTGDTRG